MNRDVPAFASGLTTRIVNGILIHGFENDKAAEAVLEANRPAIYGAVVTAVEQFLELNSKRDDKLDLILTRLEQDHLLHGKVERYRKRAAAANSRLAELERDYSHTADMKRSLDETVAALTEANRELRNTQRLLEEERKLRAFLEGMQSAHQAVINTPDDLGSMDDLMATIKHESSPHFYNGQALRFTLSPRDFRSAEHPAPGSIWQHSNGNRYCVVMITNADSDKEKYPTTVVHRNVFNGKIYSRELSDWHRSMSSVVEAKR